MNYCNAVYNNGGNLSPVDISTAQLFYGGRFSAPKIWVNSYGIGAGWEVGRHPRMMADVNGDGRADVVGFGAAGVWVSLSDGSRFSEPKIWVNSYAIQAGEWEIGKHPRMMADVNADGRDDVVGFGTAGVYVSLSDGSSFSAPKVWVSSYGIGAGGWEVGKHPRMMADVNDDGRADVVGFGAAGVWVSLSDGSRFSEPKIWVNSYAIQAGEWEIGKHPRIMADVNADGLDDVVGFGTAGVYVSLSDGSSFSAPKVWVSSYGIGAGWEVGKHPRMMADVNGDGRADVVGFGTAGVWVSLSDGSRFSEPKIWVNSYAIQAGEWSVEAHPRMMADVNGDARSDIVGFGTSGVYLSQQVLQDSAYSHPVIWIDSYGAGAGDWEVDKHPRMMADVNGDGRADIVGFGSSGVFVSMAP